MHHVFSGSASNSLKTFKEILTDLDDINAALGKEAVSSKILLKIKNTMSDRHAAEKLLNGMLHYYRVEIRITNSCRKLGKYEWCREGTFNEHESFFCDLHYVVGLAKCINESMKLWKAASENLSVESSSGTQRLVRTACKAFHHRGSQKAGSSALFQAFLKKHNVKKNSSYPFCWEQI